VKQKPTTTNNDLLCERSIFSYWLSTEGHLHELYITDPLLEGCVALLVPSFLSERVVVSREGFMI